MNNSGIRFREESGELFSYLIHIAPFTGMATYLPTYLPTS